MAKIIIMPVTKFRESKACRISRKIIPKAKEKDIKKKDKKIFNVKVIAKNKIIKKITKLNTVSVVNWKKLIQN